MCLLLLAWKTHARYDLVVAANRDEQHDRPTAALDIWPDQPTLHGGRDLLAAGTWLAAHADGRFAAVTNYRDEAAPPAGARSRGELVGRFLHGAASPQQFAQAFQADAARYAGFNLLFGNADSLWYASNRAAQFARPLAPGLYGLSNHLLDTAWPKVSAGLVALRHYIDSGVGGMDPLFDALGRQDAAASQLPWPASSGAFIAHERFGTRASTVLCREPAQHVRIEERRFAPLGLPRGSTRLQFGGAGLRA
jgi:uncharacterized protein with NRDE domain